MGNGGKGGDGGLDVDAVGVRLERFSEAYDTEFSGDIEHSINVVPITTHRPLINQDHDHDDDDRPSPPSPHATATSTHQSCVATFVSPQSHVNPSNSESGHLFGLHPILTSTPPAPKSTSHGPDPLEPNPPPNRLIKIAFPLTWPNSGTRGWRNQPPAWIYGCISCLTCLLNSG